MSIAESSVAFEDFDSKAVFQKCKDAILSQETKNFVLEFNNSVAHCALNTNAAVMRQLLESEVGVCDSRTMYFRDKPDFRTQRIAISPTRWMYGSLSRPRRTRLKTMH